VARDEALREQTTELSSYALTEECGAVISVLAECLYAWMQPALPEDLCLVREDGDPWLVSIAHEREGYLFSDRGGIRGNPSRGPHGG
jgi:hypothetical protein